MLDTGVETWLTLRQPGILPQSHRETHCNEGILTYMYHLFLFTYKHFTATECSVYKKSFALYE